ncbi:MAG: RNA-directed DNA polymerase, partial [Nitrosopumilus sp.]|nr:RNA-directed DNA polymerase [Nitrosopumilus sp.]
MYAPANNSEKQIFWQLWRDELCGKNKLENRIIIGDLNQIITDKDNTSGKAAITKEFRDILDNGFLDIWRMQHPTDREMTFRQIRDGNTYKSRLDMVLSNTNSKIHTWIGEPDIYDISDHCYIACTIPTNVNREKVNQSPFKEEGPPNYKFDDGEKWEKFHKELKAQLAQFNASEESNIETMYGKFENIIKSSMKNNFKIRGKFPLIPRIVLHLRIQKRRLENGLHAFCTMEKTQRVPRAIRKIEQNTAEWRVNIPIDLSSDTLHKWKTKTKSTHRKIGKIIEKEERKMKQKTITEAMQRLNINAVNKKESFYRSINPEKRKGSALFTNVKIGEGIVSGDPNIVRSTVLTQMINVATTKTAKPESNIKKPWFETQQAKNAKEKMHTLMASLITNITEKEVNNAIKHSGNKRSLPPDGIPNIIFKREREIMIKPITEMFNKIFKNKEIPKAWRESFTVPIPKDGDTTDPLSSRPIALLNNCYKIYTSILNKRLTYILEKGNYFGPSQGGWRAGRSTFHKILTMINTMEIKTKKEENLHLLWLDLTKFFNSIEIWALEDNMREMEYPCHFIEIINNMMKGNKTKFRTAYGYTEWGIETRGTRQGDTISATLGLIFLEPLLWHLEEQNIYTSISENTHISSSAFGDDILMMTNDGENIQKAANLCAEYSNYYGSEIGIKDKKKTAYTSIFEEDCVTITMTNHQGERNIPIIEPNDTYRYLGIQTGPKGNWTTLKNEVLGSVIGALRNMTYNYMTVRMKVEIINKVIYPAVAYRLIIAPV